MTVATSTSRIQHNCNGALTGFDFLFGVGATDEIQVILTDSAGVETTLTETTHYTISATNDDYESGGTVTTVATYASGNTITILRNVPITQESDFTENQPTLYETFEDGLDKNIRIAQQQQEEIERSIKLKKSYNPALYNIELTPVASRAIGFDAAGTALTTYPTTAVLNANFDSIQNYSNNLSTAVTAIGAAQKTLIIDVATSLSGDTTVPTTLNLMVLKSGLITVGTGVTLTINGPFSVGLSQVFTCAGTGKVVFGGGAIDKVYAEWWGIDGTADEVQIEAAMASLPAAGGIVQLFGKTYNIATTLDFTADVDHGVVIRGVATRMGSDMTNATILKWMGAAGGTLMKMDSVQEAGLEDLMLNGQGTNAAEFTLHLVMTTAASNWENTFKNISFTGAVTTAHLWLGSADAIDVAYQVFDRCKFREGKIQVLSDSENASHNILRDCSFFGATNTEYNVVINRGAIILDNPYFVGATIADVYLPTNGTVNQSFSATNFQSESLVPFLKTGDDAIIGGIITLIGGQQTLQAGNSIEFNAGTQLVLVGCSLGRPINLGAFALNILSVGNSGLTFTGTTTGVTRLDENGLLIAGGIVGTGSGLKHLRTTTQTFAVGRTNVTVTWPTTFADANYTVQVVLEDMTGNPLIWAEHVVSVTAASCVVQVNNTHADVLNGRLHVFAIHD